MQNTTQLYRQMFHYLSQYSQHCDLRHLQALSWMVSALVCSQKLNLTAWEPYVQSRAQKAQSYQRRWSRFLSNPRICVWRLYVPLVLAALSQWGSARVVSRARYQRVVEPILHDCAVGSLGRTCSAVVVASD